MPRLIALLSLILIGELCSAQITSTFDTDADEWTFFNSSNGTTVSGTFNATGGSSGGFVSTTLTASSSLQVWRAPAKFHGNHAARSLDLTLDFSLQQSVAGTHSSTTGDIRIISGSTTLVYSLPAKPATAPAWSSYSVTLNETQGWKITSTSGTTATRQQVINVLTNVTGIEIRGTFSTSGTVTSGLDEVRLNQRIIVSGPVINSFSPQKAKAGQLVTINGTNLASPGDAVSISFGGVKSEATSVSHTQVTVEVPSGARYAPLTLINKTNGTSTQSNSFFQLLFENDLDAGGRIIPSSFKSNVVIPYGDFNDNGLNGATVNDMDGDGWIDIIALQEGALQMAVFPNLGVTGAITVASFGSKISLATGASGTTNVGGAIFADLDNDGRDDFFTFTPNTIAITRNTSSPGSFHWALPFC